MVQCLKNSFLQTWQFTLYQNRVKTKYKSHYFQQTCLNITKSPCKSFFGTDLRKQMRNIKRILQHAASLTSHVSENSLCNKIYYFSSIEIYKFTNLFFFLIVEENTTFFFLLISRQNAHKNVCHVEIFKILCICYVCSIFFLCTSYFFN